MTAGVPWSVNAVEPETWATARDAARRAGLSVGEWLELTIRDGAEEVLRARRSLRTEPRSAVIEERLDELSQQINELMHQSQRRPQAETRVEREQPRSESRSDPAMAAAVAAMNSRLEVLMRDINAQRRATQEEPRERTDPALTAAVATLNGRIEALTRDINAQRRAAQEEPRERSDPALTAAVAALNGRIEALMRDVHAAQRRAAQEEPRERSDPALTAAVAALNGRIEALMRDVHAAQRRAPQEEHRAERTDPALTAAVAALNGRLEALVRDIGDADRRAPSQIEDALDRLSTRLETVLVQNNSTVVTASAEVEKRIGDLARAVENMNERLEREPERAPTPSIADLDDAVAEIMMRQSALERGSRRRALEREAHGEIDEDTGFEPASAPAPDFSGLEHQLKAMAEEMQQLRRSGLQANALDELRRQVSDLGEMLGDLAPRRSIEDLERAIEELAHRIDQAAHVAPGESYGEVATALSDIRSALADVQPAESFSVVEADLQTLSRQLDTLNGRGADGQTLARIQAEVAEVRGVLSSALPTEVLKALVDQIEVLMQRLEVGSAAAPVETYMQDAMAGLELRIDRLGERIDAVAHNAGGPAIAEISSRLEDLQRALVNIPQTPPEGFDELLHGLLDKIDATDARLAGLDGIERGLNDLFAQFEETRASAIEIAERAARSAIREAAANLTMRVPQPLAPVEPGPRLAAEHESRLVPGGPMARAETPREPLRAEPARLESAAPESVHAELPMPGRSGDLPPDFPLEPGSGSPRKVPAAPGRPGQFDAVLEPVAPRSSEPSPSAADFIAAARRAAQQAAAEKAGETPQSRAVGVVKELGATLGNSKRSLLIGILALLLVVVGTMRFADVLLPGFFSQEEPALRPSPAVVPAPAPKAPQAPAPAKPTPPAAAPMPNRSALPPSDSTLASAPPSGVLTPAAPKVITREPEPKVIAREPEPRDVTGSIAELPKPSAVAFRPNELPAAIGTPTLRAAALAGDAIASYEIAARYFDGRGVQANPLEAMRWFELARVAGSALAAYRLGNIYEKGHGVTKNLAEARRYYVAAAEAGHVKSMHNLAVLYAEGIDGKPDLKTAARWFRMGADRGLRDSQYNLAVLYARGLGVDQNLVESYRWFALAALQGDADATKKRDDVMNRLDAQSLIAAKLATATWKAIPTDEIANAVHLKPEWEKAVEPAPAKKRSTKS